MTNRRVLLAFLFISIFIVLSSLGFAASLWLEHNEIVKTAEENKGIRVKNSILANLQKSREALEHMVKIWTFNEGTSRELWEEEARLVISQTPGLRQILWVNSKDKKAWIFGNEQSFQTNNFLNKNAMNRAKLEHAHTASGIYNENGSLIGFSIYLPIYKDNFFDGYLVGVFDANTFINNSLSQEKLDKYKIVIIHDGGEVSKNVDQSIVPLNSGAETPLNLLGINLDIFAQNTESLFGKKMLYFPEIFAAAGFIIASLSFCLVYHILKAKTKTEEREKALSMLNRANHTLIKQDKLVSLGTLTAGVAHEIKNPLNIMKSFSELSMSLIEEMAHTLKNYADNFKQEDRENIAEAIGTLQANLARICEQSKRANNTIQRMLAHSRDNQEPTLTDIHSLLDEYLKLSYYDVRSRDPLFSIKITKRYDLNIPKIHLVAEDLSRVFINLFNNAYYTLAQKKKKEGNSFTPELIISTHLSDNEFEIRIRDNGYGIPAGIKEKIFTPFFTTKPVDVGTGLGLSISHAIVADHGGVLDFVSKEGDFTEFHITLPIKHKQPAIPSWVLTERN